MASQLIPTMRHATYIGPDVGWNVTKGMSALVRPHPTKVQTVLAQFDDFHAQRGGKDLAYGWHPFPAKDFSFTNHEAEPEK